ncbi:MAG TPA: hypothetical protein VMB50_04025 [Myxococcales bacterium]|nr:hypothetical protein [Myxococcales bacterium]
MDRDELLQWVEARRAASERETQELARAGPPHDSFARALRLIALGAATLGWPFPEDAVTRRENEQAAEAWAKLRRRLGNR